MNRHLNIFNSYSKSNRKYQLENDLTRALAICMQENSLFFNDVLKDIFHPTNYFHEFFNDMETNNNIAINIQHNSNNIIDFDKIFAVSLSEHIMNEDHFWNQKHETLYDPICDIVIRINKIVIIIEAKRDNVDCTAQLYNQAFNICQKNDISLEAMMDIVHPVDLNWPKLMEKAVKVHSFETATGSQNRFLNDFIDLVKTHNFRWLPEPSIFSVSYDNHRAIHRRIESVINEICKIEDYKKLEYKDRLGLWFDQPWAQEILFRISEKGNLVITVYPGNTKAQGRYIFQNEPKLKNFIKLRSKEYEISVLYHVKFTSFQRYFAGLWFTTSGIKRELHTKHNFWKYCGRKKRDADWGDIEKLFDSSLDFDWRNQCKWDSKVIDSGRNQFDMSFGYELKVEIPFDELREIDQDKSDLSGLTNLIKEVYKEYRTVYIS